jgi:N-acetylneuraminic acid mutarotase
MADRRGEETMIRKSSCSTALLMALTFSLAAAASATSAHAQGKWRLGQPIPQGANEVIGAAVGNEMLVYGGQDPVSKPMGIFYAYDPAKDAWTQLPPNPVPVHHGAAATIGRKFYVFGGMRLPDTGKVGWYPEDKAWVFDLDSKQWSALPPMPVPSGALTAIAVGKKIYVNGGAKIPAAAAMPDGLFGGGPVELLAAMQVLDTETNTWSQAAPMITPRNHHSLAEVDGKIYSIGGRVGSCFSAGWSANVWMYEDYDIVAVINGQIHVLGGEGWIDDFGGVFRAHEVYDPKSNTWSRAARMITPRHGFAAGAIGGNIIAVSGVNNAGGAGTLSVVAVNEIFEP